MVKGQRFVYVKRFVGEPNAENFRLEEFELEEPKDGEILCEAVYLSVDPYMRPYMANFPLGVTMIGEQIAKVIASKDPKYPVGAHVCGNFGWKTHTLVNPTLTANQQIDRLYLLPDFGDVSVSLGVGTLGMPGCTAYFGLLEICKPKAGETVVVTGAAGAVGSIVGQIAKLKGCNVIGFAGTDDKCELLKTEFGFDHAFNYKTADITASLKTAAPKGVDCYFDNVGGELSSKIMNQMNLFGRIAVCGSISAYNDIEPSKATVIQPAVVTKQLKMEGFIVYRWISRYMDAIKEMIEWVKEGKIQTKETFTDGFENMPQAFVDMLRGKNTGKAVVRK